MRFAAPEKSNQREKDGGLCNICSLSLIIRRPCMRAAQVSRFVPDCTPLEVSSCTQSCKWQPCEPKTVQAVPPTRRPTCVFVDSCGLTLESDGPVFAGKARFAGTGSDWLHIVLHRSHRAARAAWLCNKIVHASLSSDEARATFFSACRR